MKAAALGLSFLGGALLGLAACSPQACDPSQAGFFSGIGCEASGSYGVRNQYQRSTLAQQNAVALQSRADALNEGSRANQALLSRDQARQRLSASDRQTADLRARLAAARRNGTLDAARLNQAQAELASIQQQRNGLAGGATPDQIRAYEEQHRRLMESLSAI